MGNQRGVKESKFGISGDRVGDRLLQGVERRIKSPNPIPFDKQRRIDQILAEMASSSNRMAKILRVFNRINREL
jgi:hypothetical protein